MGNNSEQSDAKDEVHMKKDVYALDDGNIVEAQARRHVTDDADAVAKPGGFGLRHMQVLLMFSGLVLAYALRVNISIGIVAMVDNSSNTDFQQYDWNEAVRGLVLSSFFWGYIVSQVPAGLLAQRYGAKILLTGSLGVCALLTLLTPVAAEWGWEALCATRVIQGLAQGFIYPSVHTLLARWVHPSERGFLGTFTYSGTQLGTVGMLAVSGVIASSTAGWPGIFYISGGLTALWTIVWVWLGCDSPARAKRIDPIEKRFIESTLGCSTSDRKKETPWRQILRSPPFWALLVAHSAQNWGFWTLLTEIPSYMKDVLEFDIKANALWSAMPYMVMWLLCMTFSEISDLLMNRRCLSVSTGRKIFNSIGHWVPACALLALGYVSKETTWLAILLLTTAVGMNAAAYVGFLINHMDLSPNFAGTLMGMTNCVSNIMSLLGPLFVGFVVTTASDPMLWRIVFFVAAGVFFAGNGIFLIFGSGKIQPWNEIPTHADDVDTRVQRISTSTDTVETADIADAVKSRL